MFCNLSTCHPPPLVCKHVNSISRLNTKYNTKYKILCHGSLRDPLCRITVLNHDLNTQLSYQYLSVVYWPQILYAWLYTCKFHIYRPISAHGLWQWFIFLTLFARLTYVNVLHWIVRLYYYGFLVNESIGLILAIQVFYTSSLSVLYSKDVYPNSSIVWSTTFPFIALKSHYTI